MAVTARRTLAVAAASVAAVAAVGGTALAAGGSGEARTSTGVSRAEVTQIVRTYIANHKASIQGPKPSSIVRVLVSSNPGFHTVRTFGKWTMSADCESTGVTVEFTGSGAVFGTNTLGTTNGGPGSSYETFGDKGVSFGVAPGVQGSQTVDLFGPGANAWTVTYFMNAMSGSTVQCDLGGTSTFVKTPA
jgi:hypothetical protein